MAGTQLVPLPLRVLSLAESGQESPSVVLCWRAISSISAKVSGFIHSFFTVRVFLLKVFLLYVLRIRTICSLFVYFKTVLTVSLISFPANEWQIIPVYNSSQNVKLCESAIVDCKLFNVQERNIAYTSRFRAPLKERSQVKYNMQYNLNKSCKTCTTVATLISILFQLAANDGVPSTTGRYMAASYNKMLMRVATVVQVLQDFVLCFIAGFILLVINP